MIPFLILLLSFSNLSGLRPSPSVITTTGSRKITQLDTLTGEEFSIRYRVKVDNDMDRLRLLWLVKEKGEDKLNRSIDKYIARYPNNLPYVSYLLKQYGLKVPPSVYAPNLLPQSAVYLIVLADHSQLKIGMSESWEKRAFSFVKPPKTVVDTLDVDKSCAVMVSSSKEARRIETLLKQSSIGYIPDRPAFLTGVTECRVGDALPLLIELLLQEVPNAKLKTLRKAVQELKGLK